MKPEKPAVSEDLLEACLRLRALASASEPSDDCDDDIKQVIKAEIAFADRAIARAQTRIQPMSGAEIRIVIAEACGWLKLDKPKRLNVGFEGWANCFWQSPQQRGSSLAEKDPPDYPNDLNAIHEAEKQLTEEQLVWYGRKLCDVVCPTSTLRGDAGYWVVQAKANMATARQRCEAFIKTACPEKWKE